MEIQPDFKELLVLFNEHEVEYLIVGGFALAFHGAPRFTGDIDLLVRPTSGNAQKILAALDQFGFGAIDLDEIDLQEPDRVIQLGMPPVRIDLLTSISGVSWHEAARNKVKGRYDDVAVNFIGRLDFIANKKATGRLKDLADIEALDNVPPGEVR